MLTLQIISATCLATMVYLSWRSNRNYNKERKRLDSKIKYGNIIERRLKALERDNDEVVKEFMRSGVVDRVATAIIKEENDEIKRMIEKYERM